MSTEFGETATTVEEVAVGAVKSAAEVASDPVRSARRQVRSFERKGTPVVRRINRRLSAMMPERITVLGVELNGKMPENLAVKGLQLVRGQARRQDPLGGVAKGTLRIINASFKTIARTATRLEHASELTPRPQQAAPKPRRRATRRHAA